MLSKYDKNKYQDAGGLMEVSMNSQKLSQEVNSEVEDNLYGKDFLNPFRKNDKITLTNIDSNPRLKKVLGLKDSLVGGISSTIRAGHVNVAYWETMPPVLKNIPVGDVKLHSSNPITAKIRYFVISLIRKVVYGK